MTPLIIIIIILALVFDFLNGIHDSSNIVATMIASRAFSPRIALGMTAVANFFGPFIFGVAVAETIGNEVVAAEAISLLVILTALVSAIMWNLLTWYLGFPSSSSHALVGGLVGAVLIGAGWEAILLPGLTKVLLTLLTSPLIGFIFGYLFLKILILLSWNATPKVNTIFKRSQVFTSISLALSHGTNDAQKTMGIITLALVTGGVLEAFVVPQWVVFACAAMIALGTAVGGWRLIRTLGGKFYPHQAHRWICLAIILIRCHIGCITDWRTGEHYPGGQFIHHGGGCCRKEEQGALGCCSGYRHGLGAYNSCYCTGGSRIILDSIPFHSIEIS